MISSPWEGRREVRCVDNARLEEPASIDIASSDELLRKVQGAGSRRRGFRRNNLSTLRSRPRKKPEIRPRPVIWLLGFLVTVAGASVLVLEAGLSIGTVLACLGCLLLAIERLLTRR